MVRLGQQVTPKYARRCPATQKHGRGMREDRFYHTETLSRWEGIENQPAPPTTPQRPFLITRAMKLRRRGHGDGRERRGGEGRGRVRMRVGMGVARDDQASGQAN